MASCGRRSGERCFAGEPGFPGDFIGERMNDVSDDCFLSFIACDAMNAQLTRACNATDRQERDA